MQLSWYKIHIVEKPAPLAAITSITCWLWHDLLPRHWAHGLCKYWCIS